MAEALDPNKEYPDPHPWEDSWNAVKHLAENFPDEDIEEMRKRHQENYHTNCKECSHIKMHNMRAKLTKSFNETHEKIRDVAVAKMSGICRNCSTLRDIDGRCGGCND